MAKETTLIRQGALAYAWEKDSFLTKVQAEYAMARLWSLVAGKARWNAPPVIIFPAISHHQVEFELNLAPGALPWMLLSNVLPERVTLDLDTDRLPALCRVQLEQDRYRGKGLFPLDLPAAVFLGLTRWEEWTRPNLDEMGLHNEDATLSARQGFRDRPILDEWALVIRNWLQFWHPRWQAEVQETRLWITHDIDRLCYFKDFSRVLRGIAKGIIRHQSLSSAANNLIAGIRALRSPNTDPCYQGVRWLMDFDESLGLKGTFFFMTSAVGQVDDGYDLTIPRYSALVEEVRSRGHALGWHIGYRASQDVAVYVKERDVFRNIVGDTTCGVRHHYLAWRGPKSWRLMDESGFSFDTSVGYNYCAGFRCGTAHAFPVFDLERNSALALVERPLIIMDSASALLAGRLPGSVSSVQKLYARVARVGGEFTVLIHNSFAWECPHYSTVFMKQVQSCASQVNG